MIRLKHASASQQIPIGHFVDSTDGDTAETALTIANTDVKLWKKGATSLVDKNSGGATHMSGGVYYLVLDATDTDTIDVGLCQCSSPLATVRNTLLPGAHPVSDRGRSQTPAVPVQASAADPGYDDH